MKKPAELKSAGSEDDPLIECIDLCLLLVADERPGDHVDRGLPEPP